MKRRVRPPKEPAAGQDRCVDCDWLRSVEDDEDARLITRGDSYICLRLGRRVASRHLWARACPHFAAIR
jgi:hypothetical protein